MLTLNFKELKALSSNVAKNIDKATDEELIKLGLLDPSSFQVNPIQVIGMSYSSDTPSGCLIRLLENKNLFTITNGTMLYRFIL